MKRIGIMQPYFLPYIGYFQLMNMVDEFVLYDNIQFTKKGWLHRNRMLQNGKDEYFTLPLKKDSDYLDVNQRFLANNFPIEKKKILNKIKANYQKAPFFKETFPIIENIFYYPELNLFLFIENSLNIISSYLNIRTPIIISSAVSIDHQLKGKNKVIAITKALNGTHYINPIGGLELYDKQEFKNNEIELSFFETSDFSYRQFKNDFVPFLSILDIMMFNDISQIKTYLNQYSIL